MDMNTDILAQAVSEAMLDDMNTDAFKNRESAEDYNNIMDSVAKYSNQIFTVPVNSIPVYKVTNEGTYVADFDDVSRYMHTNNIASLEDAVHNVCMENGVDSIGLVFDEAVINEAKRQAANAKRKKKGGKVCKQCHLPATECQCEAFVEQLEPEVEAFESIVETIKYCQSVGIPIALRG